MCAGCVGYVADEREERISTIPARAYNSIRQVCNALMASLARLPCSLIVGLSLVCVGSYPVPGAAQELTPRAYWPVPVGTRLFVAGLAHIDGNVLFDPSIPLYQVETEATTALAGYLQSFRLFGRSSNVLVKLPYVWGETKGLVETLPASRQYSNFADLSVTLAVNLIGAPSMTVEEFQAFRADPRPILGVSVEVIAPTGDYTGSRLVNTGANRWAIKPEFGFMYPLTKKLLLEVEAGVWFYEDDDEFLPGKREQDPLFTSEVHLIRRFSPGFWVSLDWTYYNGGRQTIGGNRLADTQSNSRIGGTLVKPLSRRQAIKIGYATALKTRFSADFDQYLFSYQVLLY